MPTMLNLPTLLKMVTQRSAIRAPQLNQQLQSEGNIPQPTPLLTTQTKFNEPTIPPVTSSNQAMFRPTADHQLPASNLI